MKEMKSRHNGIFWLVYTCVCTIVSTTKRPDSRSIHGHTDSMSTATCYLSNTCHIFHLNWDIPTIIVSMTLWLKTENCTMMNCYMDGKWEVKRGGKRRKEKKGKWKKKKVKKWSKRKEREMNKMKWNEKKESQRGCRILPSLP